MNLDFVALDAGCGNGRYTAALKTLGMKEVYGIDLSKNNIADAKKRAQDHRWQIYITNNVMF